MNGSGTCGNSDQPAGSGAFFQCQRCANCCRWPGDVCVDEREVDRIAQFLGLEPGIFIEGYTRLRANRTGLSLTENANGECVFLAGNRCRINDVKPAQCRGFPNHWNFPGWRQVCEAVPVPFEPETGGSADPSRPPERSR